MSSPTKLISPEHCCICNGPIDTWDDLCSIQANDNMSKFYHHREHHYDENADKIDTLIALMNVLS